MIFSISVLPGDWEIGAWSFYNMAMRIISGNLGGRTLRSPQSSRTHPMSEKARGALFNALGDISQLDVLDAFAGSGALGLEAISRGAKFVTAVDSDKKSTDTVKDNAMTLGVSGQIKVTRANISSWLDNNPKVKFDLVLCDPPYDSVNNEALVKAALAAKIGGTIVFSLPPNHELSLPKKGYEPLGVKNYGDATLAFCRRIS